jgi:hypothetical protein
MFIRAVIKKDKDKVKSYTYYRLTHSYRAGNKSRQLVVLNLGKLEGISQTNRKLLGIRIEEIITGKTSLFTDSRFAAIEDLAQEFACKVVKDKIFPSLKSKSIAKAVKKELQTVDLQTIEQLESKSIGAEWLVKQTFDKLDFPGILRDIGLGEKQVIDAQLLLTGKLIHPSSELEAQRWLNENSAALELYNKPNDITRYSLYQAATRMYLHKADLDKGLYHKIGELFPKRSKIVIYDLTNMYFEGQMNSSKKANFGRSKQKRNDRRLIGLALSIDELGFVRSSRFYDGNVSESGTFIDLINDLSDQLVGATKKPLIVMDAGISTEENLKLLRSEKYNYDYVCVSRSKPKEYNKLTDNATTITDNRGNKIALTKIEVEGKEDCFLHIKSDQKQKKEASMDKKLSNRLVKQLEEIKAKLPKKRTLKKITKIHEKVGGIKAKLARVGYLYDITYTEDTEQGIVTDIQWKRIKSKEKPKGEYFLRYTLSAYKENEIWDLYNLTRDVESVFRCLKTDLDIRPIYHQKDKYIEPHIWLGILAYQLVNYIKRNLAKNNINDSWTTIVNKMSSMQSSTTTGTNNKQEQLYIKLCTRPTQYQKSVFRALNYKHRPYIRKTKVVTQM